MTEHINRIHEYLGGEASDEESCRLEAWMKQDESHVDLFVREAFLHQQLREALKDEVSVPAPIDDEKDRLLLGDGVAGPSIGAAPCAPSDSDPSTDSGLLPGVSVFHQCFGAFSSWPVPVFGTLLGALFVVGLCGWFIGIRGLPLDAAGQNRPQARAATSIPHKTDDVATVKDISKCLWDKAKDGSMLSGSRLSPGNVLNLLSGTAQVIFDCGATVTLTGPALFRIDSEIDATLHHGGVSVYVPEKAYGFLVHTSEMDVRDLGTEFTLNVNNEKQTKLEVVDGEVEVDLPQNEPLQEKKRSLIKGEYLRVDRSTPDESPSSRQLNVFRGVRVDFAAPQSIGLLEILNENKDRYRHDPANGCLSVDTAWGTVFGKQGEDENVFLLPAPQEGDFDVVLSVASFVPQRMSEHVGLLILDDTDNFYRIIYAKDAKPGDTYVKFNVETASNPGPEVREPVSFGSGPFQLRLMRRGEEISGWWSCDGFNWNLRDHVALQHKIRHVGFYASKGQPYPKNATPYRQALIKEFRIEIKE